MTDFRYNEEANTYNDHLVNYAGELGLFKKDLLKLQEILHNQEIDIGNGKFNSLVEKLEDCRINKKYLLDVIGYVPREGGMYHKYLDGIMKYFYCENGNIYSSICTPSPMLDFKTKIIFNKSSSIEAEKVIKCIEPRHIIFYDKNNILYKLDYITKSCKKIYDNSNDNIIVTSNYIIIEQNSFDVNTETITRLEEPIQSNNLLGIQEDIIIYKNDKYEINHFCVLDLKTKTKNIYNLKQDNKKLIIYITSVIIDKYKKPMVMGTANSSYWHYFKVFKFNSPNDYKVIKEDSFQGGSYILSCSISGKKASIFILLQQHYSNTNTPNTLPKKIFIYYNDIDLIEEINTSNCDILNKINLMNKEFRDYGNGNVQFKLETQPNVLGGVIYNLDEGDKYND